MGTLLSRITKRTKAIAEAGHPQQEDEPNVSEPAVSGKLLVVGHETIFSQTVIDYALDMARRMSYEIVALNAAPLSCNAFKPFSASQKKLCDEFEQMSVEHVQSFKQEAEKMGIPFAHVVKFAEPEKALEMIQQEYNPIDFVITDEQPVSLENQISETQRPSRRVYVYSMI